MKTGCKIYLTQLYENETGYDYRNRWIQRMAQRNSTNPAFSASSLLKPHYDVSIFKGSQSQTKIAKHKGMRGRIQIFLSTATAIFKHNCIYMTYIKKERERDLTSRKYSNKCGVFQVFHLINTVSLVTSPTLHPTSGLHFHCPPISLPHLVHGSPEELDITPDTLSLHSGIMTWGGWVQLLKNLKFHMEKYLSPKYIHSYMKIFHSWSVLHL